MHEIEDSSSAVGLRDCTVRRSFDGTNADQWEYISEIQGIAQVHPVTSKKRVYYVVVAGNALSASNASG